MPHVNHDVALAPVVERVEEQQHHLRVGCETGRTDELGADLEELVSRDVVGVLVAQDRIAVVDAYGQILLVEHETHLPREEERDVCAQDEQVAGSIDEPVGHRLAAAVEQSPVELVEVVDRRLHRKVRPELAAILEGTYEFSVGVRLVEVERLGALW